MHLSDKEIALIRDSYREFLPQADRVSVLFYKDLFNRAPKLRGYFSDNVSEQGMRFMAAIGFIIDNVENEERLNEKLALLAEGHAHYKLLPEDYREMQEALIDTFKHAFKADWNDDLERAWRSAFTQICDAMIARTEELRFASRPE